MLQLQDTFCQYQLSPLVKYHHHHQQQQQRHLLLFVNHENPVIKFIVPTINFMLCVLFSCLVTPLKFSYKKRTKFT